MQIAVGAISGPRDCFLTMRGAKTLAVRMDRHCTTPRPWPRLLVDHPEVDSVMYPGLDTHPGHEVAARQMRGFGGMISFQANRRRCGDARHRGTPSSPWPSRWGRRSLIEHPAVMTHASTAGSALEVPDDLVRLSVGIEDIDDLLEDLRLALDQGV